MNAGMRRSCSYTAGMSSGCRARSTKCWHGSVEENQMKHFKLKAAAATLALLISFGSGMASAQKSGGILKMPDFASPASMSIHEEVTRAAVTALMPVFNNLVLFDQHKIGRASCRERV